jgi:serine/threonine-protein kinase
MFPEELVGLARGNTSRTARPRRIMRAGWLVPRAFAALLGLIALGSSGAAFAQEDPQQKAAAEALFNEAQELLFNRNYEAACKRFEQSQAIDPGVGTLLYLAECYERLGRLASAWATYREAESAARAAGQADRNRVANERANRISSKLSRLTLRVAAANEGDGFELTINGKRLNAALFNVPFPVDAGNYELIARAPGRAQFKSTIEVKAGGEQKTVEIPELPLGDPEPGTPAIAPGVPGSGTLGSAGVAAPDPLADTSSPFSPRQTVGLVVAGAGVLTIGGGVLFGVSAKSKDDEAVPSCPDGCYTRAAAELNQDARTLATFANISYVVGAAALVTGAVLYFLPEKQPASAARRLPFDVSAELGRGRQLVTVGGAF